MDFSIFYQPGANRFKWANMLFYVASALLLIAVFCYGIFSLKVYLENQRLDQLQGQIQSQITPQDTLFEKQVLDYKKRIEDFGALVNNHRISSKVFDFIEQKTLPNIWFSSFSVLEAKNEIDLVGQAQNMEALNNQIRIFEQSPQYVKGIGALNSELQTSGSVKFTLSLSLDPSVFAYGQ